MGANSVRLAVFLTVGADWQGCHVFHSINTRGKMSTGIRRLAGAVLVAAAVSTASATAASADVRLWQHQNYSGGYASRAGGDATYHGNYFNNGTRLWDAVTSVYNARSGWTCFYTDHYGGGDYFCLNSYVASPNVGTRFNDRLSSHYI